VHTKPIYGTDRMHWRTTPCSLIRKGDWKLIHFFETNTTELYNLKSDPGEQNDLAAEDTEKLSELLSLLQKWQVENDANIPRTLNPDFDPNASPTPKKGSGAEKAR
jgi:arylsulfatase A-like enzyme